MGAQRFPESGKETRPTAHLHFSFSKPIVWEMALAALLLVVLVILGTGIARSTPAEPYLVKDINIGTWGSSPQNLAVVSDTLFFAAEDGTHGVELWKSDGTLTGTVMVKDINPDWSASPSYLVNVDGTLFFSADDGTHGQELWALEVHVGPDPAINKAVVGAPVVPGTLVTFTLTFGNVGFTQAGEIVITDVVPIYLSHLTFASAGAVVTPTGTISYTWLVEDLGPEAGGVITITGILSPGLPGGLMFTNTAVITAISDTNPANSTDSVRVTVAYVPPEAGDDAATTPEDTPALIDVLANDDDANGDPLSIAAVGLPAHGTAVVSGTMVLYTPIPDFYGSDAFSYTVSDGHGGTAGALVSVVVVRVRFLIYLPLVLRGY
ncbi:MAG: ELWxxDGT repeat protein [Chloroflexia bacterium]